MCGYQILHLLSLDQVLFISEAQTDDKEADKINNNNDILEAYCIAHDEVVKRRISNLPVSKLPIFADTSQGKNFSVYHQDFVLKFACY
jgi:hypothetical protein